MLPSYEVYFIPSSFSRRTISLFDLPFRLLYGLCDDRISKIGISKLRSSLIRQFDIRKTVYFATARL